MCALVCTSLASSSESGPKDRPMLTTQPVPLHGAGREPVTDTDVAVRLDTLRKDRAITLQVLSERSGVHVSQIRRFEGGNSKPTVDVLHNLALALNTSADSLLFGQGDRGPDDDRALHLEALNRLDDDEKHTVRALIESILLRHEARRLARTC